MMYLVFFLAFIGMFGVAYAEETFLGHSSVDPPVSEITPRKPTAVNVLFQYTSGPYAITNLTPQVEITPHSAQEYVKIDVEPIELNRGDIRRIPIMVTVDQDIPHEKIFLSISFSGKHFQTDSVYKSSWIESLTLDIGSVEESESKKHRVLEPEPKCREGTILKEDTCIEADPICGEGTTYQDGVCLDESNTNSENWTTSYPKIIQSPLKQWKQGASPVQINCSKGKFLMVNPNNEKPACLFVSSSMIRFAENGWIPVRNLVLDSPTVNIISGDGGEFTKRFFSYFEIKDENSIIVHDINDKSLVNTINSGDKIITDCIDAEGSSEITVSTLVQVNVKDNNMSMTHEKQTWPKGFCEDDESILNKYYSRFFTRDSGVSKPEPEQNPEPEPEPESYDETKLRDAKKALETAYFETVNLGGFYIKDVIVGYGIYDNTLVIDIPSRFMEPNSIKAIRQDVQSIVGYDVKIDYILYDEPIERHIETVMPYWWSQFLNKQGIEYSPKEQIYWNKADGFHNPDRVCSPIIASNGTELYISSTFDLEPFQITGTFIDKKQPDDCHKIWKTETILVEPDRVTMLCLKNQRD